MSSRLLRHAVGRLTRTVALPGLPARSDGRLLGDFIARRDEAAFAELLRRHGPMVFGVCRRALANRHDAEDAFQATFLVLARKARSLARREAVAGWLYGVALRTARKARALNARRQLRESQLRSPARAQTDDDRLRGETRPILDAEVARLPEKYRLAVLLCDLEGLSRRHAAAALRVPEGTLSSRLARAHALLRSRLMRRGVGLPAGGVAALLTAEAAAVPPPVLMGTTARVAALCAAGHLGEWAGPATVLAEGVMQTMRLTKLKLAVAVVATAAVVGGIGWGTRPGVVMTEAAGPTNTPRSERGSMDGAAPAKPPAAAAADDRQLLQGTWVAVAAESNGHQTPAAVYANYRLVLNADTIQTGNSEPTQYTLDASRHPKCLSWRKSGGQMVEAIYELAGDTLIFCAKPEVRPTSFTAPAGSNQELIVFRRDAGPDTKPSPPPPAKNAGEADDRRAIQGDWVAVAGEVDGRLLSATEVARLKLNIGAEIISEGTTAGTYQLDPTRQPKWIDTRVMGQNTRGIYALAGGTLIVCQGTGHDKERPTTFTGRAGSQQGLMIFRRQTTTPKPPAAGSAAVPPPEGATLKLKHVSAEDTAKALQALFPGDGSGRPTSPTVLADAATNTLLVSGRPEDIATIRRIVQQLDLPPNDPTAIETIPLARGDAAALAETLQKLLGTSGAGPAGSLRITTDDRTNSITVSGRPADLKAVRSLIEILTRNTGPAVKTDADRRLKEWREAQERVETLRAELAAAEERLRKAQEALKRER
jgi:RNA polymerase sigma-70 factor (ECF subfamily)